jgi:hypothetical protein
MNYLRISGFTVSNLSNVFIDSGVCGGGQLAALDCGVA